MVAWEFVLDLGGHSPGNKQRKGPLCKLDETRRMRSHRSRRIGMIVQKIRGPGTRRRFLELMFFNVSVCFSAGGDLPWHSTFVQTGPPTQKQGWWSVAS